MGNPRAIDRFTAFRHREYARAVNRQLDAAMKQALAGRKLSAVPPDGRVFVVFHDLGKLSDEIPPISLLLPVTGYKEFRDTFLTDAERKTFQPGADGVDSVKSVTGDAEVTVFLVDLKDYERALVWVDEEGSTWLAYNDPGWIAARHAARRGNDQVLVNMRRALTAIAEQVTRIQRSD